MNAMLAVHGSHKANQGQIDIFEQSKQFRTGRNNLVKLSVLEIFGIGTKLDKAFGIRTEHTEISIYCRSVTLPKRDNVSKHVTHNEGVK